MGIIFFHAGNGKTGGEGCSAHHDGIFSSSSSELEEGYKTLKVKI